MMQLPASFADGILDLTCEIQSIPAPTFYETRRAAFFLKQFRALNLKDVQVDPAGNVLARMPGGGQARPLVVSAHMDTVHPLDTPLDCQKLEDRIVGPGIGDNALGLAAVVGLVKLLRMRESALPGDLWLAANVSEEGLGDLRGIQAIVDQFGGSPLAYLVVEGMGLGTVLHRGLGVERYKISVQTPGGHSWVDYGQPSAIHELARIVTRITDLPLPRNPCTTLNVGVIQGGTSVNTIAAQAWLELDLRSEDRSTLARLVKDVNQLVHAARRAEVTLKMERIGKRQAGQVPVDHPLVLLACEVLGELGMEARLDVASTDANLPLSRGYPSICVGITLGNNAHTRDEYILTKPVAQGLAQLLLLVERAWEKMK
jgi:acetylornithine deacetylase/succinyl-diaminopimelate desuccinylase-like protein